jgi:hypothetical protein
MFLSRISCAFVIGMALLSLTGCGGPQTAEPTSPRTGTSAPPADDQSSWTPDAGPGDQRGTVTPPPGGWTYTEHLPWAKRMADEVAPSTNTYGNSPTTMVWKDEDGATETSNRSVCASFVYTLLMKAYGYTADDFNRWFASTGPTPAYFSTAIKNGKGFRRITKATDLLPGDILSIVYPPDSTSIGHVMIVAQAPEAQDETTPKVAGTKQYVVWVYDSTSSPHSTSDTRAASGMKGAGKGAIRVYADATTGEIKGYTWSLSTGSTYYDMDTRPLSAGRLDGTITPGG